MIKDLKKYLTPQFQLVGFSSVNMTVFNMIQSKPIKMEIIQVVSKLMIIKMLTSHHRLQIKTKTTNNKKMIIDKFKIKKKPY